jgi:hypothetical protein
MSINNDEIKDENDKNEIKEIKEIKDDSEEKEPEKNEIKEVKEIIVDDDEEENEQKKNKIEDESKKDEPYFKDEIKKVYKIDSTPLFKEISIIKTKAKVNPPNRCYLTAEYSQKNNSIICIGGSEDNCNQYNKITEYDISKNFWNIWKSDNQLGFELSGHTSNLVVLNKEEKIFVFGGYDNWKHEFTAQSYLINIKEKNYEKINYNSDNELPMPRTYHSSNYDIKNNSVYIYGGTDMNIYHCKGDNFQALWKFNLIEKIWNKIDLEQRLQDGPPRGHTSILINDKLYIFGGTILFRKFINNMYIIFIKEKKIEKIDYNEESFKKGVIPPPMAFHSAALIDENKFLIHGGLNKSYNAMNTCYIYYINEKKFDKILIPLIPKLFGHKIVINSDINKLYIIGGMDNFKYFGDEKLIYQIEKDEDNLINENDGNYKFFPMLNILEIFLNKKDEKKKLEGDTTTPEGDTREPEGDTTTPEGDTKTEENKINIEKSNKRKRWKKLFYVNIN